MKTLFEQVTENLDFQMRKHELQNDYVERSINGLTNYEFLQELSWALEAREARP